MVVSIFLLLFSWDPGCVEGRARSLCTIWPMRRRMGPRARVETTTTERESSAVVHTAILEEDEKGRSVSSCLVDWLVSPLYILCVCACACLPTYCPQSTPTYPKRTNYGGGQRGKGNLPKEMSFTRKIMYKNRTVLTTRVVMPRARMTAKPTLSRKWLSCKLLRREKGKMNTAEGGM